MKKEKEKAPYVTKADIEEFLHLEEQRKSLSRQADDLERQAKPLKEKLAKFVELEAGPTKSIDRSGYVLAFKSRAGRVEWKSEFINAVSAAAAEQLVRDCPKVDYLTVEKAA